MTSIKAQIEAHRPLVASQTAQPGVVAVEKNDIYELAQIIGERIINFEHATRTHFFLKVELFESLVAKAHDKLHGAKEGENLLSQWIGSTDPLSQELSDAFNNALDEAESEEPEEDNESEEAQSRRNVSVHYATQIVVASISASHGLDSEPLDVVELAGKIDKFIKG